MSEALTLVDPPEELLVEYHVPTATAFFSGFPKISVNGISLQALLFFQACVPLSFVIYSPLSFRLLSQPMLSAEKID